jgi:uncharacterized protein involved in exopolysaccharide biosynthesis
LIRDEFDDMDDEGGGPGLDPKVLLLYGAWRSRFVIVATSVVGCVLGIAAGASMPNVYTSRARLDYRPGMAELQNAEAAAGIDATGYRQSVPGMTDEQYLLDDMQVFEKIAAAVGPERILATPDPTQYDADASMIASLWHRFQAVMVNLTHPGLVGPTDSPKAIRGAALSLKSRTSLQAARDASVFLVSFDGYSKQEAQDMAKLIMQGYVDRHSEYYSVGVAYEASQERQAEAKEEYDAISTEYREHSGRCGFVDIEAQKDTTIGQIGFYEQELAKMKAERQSVLARLVASRAEYKLAEAYLEEPVPAVMSNNPRYVELEKRQIQAESDLIELSGNAGLAVSARDQKKLALEKQIQALTESLEDLEPVIETSAAGVRLVPNAVHLALEVRISLEQENDRGLGAGINAMEANLRGQRERLQSIGVCEDQHTGYVLDIETARAKWTGLRVQTSLQRQLQDVSDNGQANLTVQSAPTLPLGKGGPSRFKPLVAGIGIGAMLGLVMAVLRQLMDKRVRYPETVEKTLGLRVLGVVPESSSLRRIRPGHLDVA